MKKVLLVGMFPEEVREMLLAQKDLALVHDSNEFFENELFFETLKNYDAVILAEASDFSFHILEEMAVLNKPVLFRDAYESPEKNAKVKLLAERATRLKLFFEKLQLFDGAPLYGDIAKYVESPVRRMVIDKSFATSLSEEQLKAQIDEYLYCIDKALKRERKRTAHFFSDTEKKICRVEGKVNFADYTLNVIRKDEKEEKISVLFGVSERLSVKDGELTFYPRQGTVKTTPADVNYLPIVEPLFNKFVQSIGQI